MSTYTLDLDGTAPDSQVDNVDLLTSFTLLKDRPTVTVILCPTLLPTAVVCCAIFGDMQCNTPNTHCSSSFGVYCSKCMHWGVSLPSTGLLCYHIIEPFAALSYCREARFPKPWRGSAPTCDEFCRWDEAGGLPNARYARVPIWTRDPRWARWSV